MNISKPQQLGPSNNTNCGNVSHSYNKTWNNCDISVTDEKRQILEWLSPLAPRKRHRDVRESQVNGIGGWLLLKEEFVSWRTGEDGVVSPVVLCYGDPGVGKTHISSLVIETLCHQSDGKQVAVACLYCDFHAHKEQSIAHMLSAILKQVVSGLEHIPEEIEAAFQRSKNQIDGRELESGEIRKLLVSSLRTLQRSYICIDALDEFPREHRPEIFKSLVQIIRESPSTRLFLTGRPHIRDEIRRYFAGSAEIQIKPSKEDIKKYLSERISNDTHPEVMDQDLREEILQTIAEKNSEIFLLVSLSMNAILAQSTLSRRRKTLRQMTCGQEMGDAYAATLERIRAQEGDKAKLGIEVLMWISRSERPLSPGELCHALAIERNSTELDPKNVPAMETLLSCCLGLVTADEEGSSIRLIHLTLQEYLVRHSNLFSGAHSKMAEVCLTYLNFQEIRDLPLTPPASPPQIPFLDYASCFWGVHARKELSEHTKSLALQLLDRYDHHVSTRLFLVNRRPWVYGWYGEYALRSASRFTGLHAIAYFGAVEIAMALIRSRDCDVNGKDYLGYTPLLWAAENNCERVCELLLGLGDVDPNAANNKGRSPLLQASTGGHEGIVKLLLEHKEVNPCSTDKVGNTPLLLAAENGYEGTVKLLLGRKEVNPGSADEDGDTPLSRAAKNGCGGVVKLLLERKEVNPGSTDYYGRTPLSRASKNGHEGIVKLLLERKEVNPGSTENGGKTPLSWAAENGHEEIVKRLLKRKEANPCSIDMGGKTPLLWAVVNGHEGTMKLLLQRKEVNSDSANYYGRTPLLQAAMNGHEGIVKLLLEREEVNPCSTDMGGKTPLSGAAGNGHEGIVKLLLERKEANPGSSNGCGKTPLSEAAKSGHKGIVKLLLEHKEVNPGSVDRYDRTPLSEAAKNGHGGIVKLLLQSKEVNPGSTENGGKTPLLLAAENGHEGIVKLLLERKEVNPGSTENGGKTPLSRTAENGHEGIVKLLLERKEVNPGSTENGGKTPLSRAAGNGHEGIVKLLLERKEVNPGSVDKDGDTPLSGAAENGYEGIVKLLLEHKKVTPLLI